MPRPIKDGNNFEINRSIVYNGKDINFHMPSMSACIKHYEIVVAAEQFGKGERRCKLGKFCRLQAHRAEHNPGVRPLDVGSNEDCHEQ